MRRERLALTRVPAFAAILLLLAVQPVFAAPIAMDAGWTTENYIWIIPAPPSLDPAGPVLDPTPSDNSSVLAGPNSVTLNGPDGADFFDQQTWFESAILYWFLVPATGTLSFDWSYVSNDAAPDPFDPSLTIPGSPSYDPAGYFVDEPVESLPLQSPRLIDDAGLLSQNGSVSIHVVAGQKFGFYVVSVDNIGGAAALSITNVDLNTPDVPEPSAALLFVTGAALLAAMRKLRRSSDERS